MRFITSTTLVLAVIAAVASAEWELKSENEATRANLCELNKAFCVTNCGGVDKAPMNFCNTTNMVWNCGCSDKVPNLSEHEWPIVRAECQGRRQDCQQKCVTGDAQKAPACQAECAKTYDCDQGVMPPSELRVSSIDAEPGSGADKSDDEDADGDSGDSKNSGYNLASGFSWSYTVGALSLVAGAMWTL